jgi:hypothetical protein
VAYSILNGLISAAGATAHYVAACDSRTLPPHWLSELVARWRHAPASPFYSEPLDTALERLETAHASTVRPIIFMIIDGLDEIACRSPEFEQPVRRMLDFAVSQDDSSQTVAGPRLVIVVTCRTAADLEDVWPPASTSSSLSVVPVETFSTEEFATACAEQLEDRTVADRLMSTVTMDKAMPTERVVPVAAIPHAVDSALHRSLQHPLLWRFFCQLSPSHQHAVLDGSVGLLAQLTTQLLEWFCRKARARRTGFSADDAQTMLRKAASVFGSPGRVAKKESDWQRPIVEDCHFGHAEARLLYSEALSFGIIEEVESGTWRWRHPFVCSCLARQ